MEERITDTSFQVIGGEKREVPSGMPKQRG